MKRRDFIQMSTVGVMATLNPVSAFSINPIMPIWVAPLLRKVGEAFLSVVLEKTIEYVFFDDDKKTPSQCQHIYNSANQFMSTQGYAPVTKSSGVPMLSYDMQASSGFTSSNTVNAKSLSSPSGFNSYLSSSFIKQNEKGDIINTQTAFIANPLKEPEVIAFLPESFLSACLLTATVLQKTGKFTKLQIKELLVPFSSLTDNTDLEKKFTSVEYKTKYGKITFDGEVHRKNGLTKSPTHIDGTLYITPDKNSNSIFSQEEPFPFNDVNIGHLFK
jgi:hypothetical protein